MRSVPPTGWAQTSVSAIDASAYLGRPRETIGAEGDDETRFRSGRLIAYVQDASQQVFFSSKSHGARALFTRSQMYLDLTDDITVSSCCSRKNGFKCPHMKRLCEYTNRQKSNTYRLLKQLVMQAY